MGSGKKNTISAYGAGNYANRFLPLLKEHYDIQYIMDRSPEKQGQVLYGIPVVPLNEDAVNRYPVIILMGDTNSALEVLESLSCTSQKYYVLPFLGGCGIAKCDFNSIEELEKSCRFFQMDMHDFSHVELDGSGLDFVQGEPRVFNIASPADFDATGGPCACLRNLYLANREYSMIPNFYTLCPSTAFIPSGGIPDFGSCEINVKERSETFLLPKVDNIAVESINQIVKLCFQLEYIWDFLQKAHRRLLFSDRDIFLLQDPFIAHVFIHMFPQYERVVHAYHAQGTLSSELKKSFPGIDDIFDAIQFEHLKKIKQWIFPSKGAMDGFLRTANNDMRKAAGKCCFHVGYNGYEPKSETKPDKEFSDYLATLNDVDIVFASATFLYRNKGVERIPKILSEIKKQTGLKIHWILIGGGEMEEVVEEQISLYLNPDDYTWFRKRFENQDNVFELFKRSDFYIMMHRVSVFDLSTLQAMSYGCVPFLSAIDGNLELCGFNNGILIDPDNTQNTLSNALDDYFAFTENRTRVWSKGLLDKKKVLNEEIIKNEFNNRRFLQKYKNVLLMQRMLDNDK